jgi:hypothetical protein
MTKLWQYHPKAKKQKFLWNDENLRGGLLVAGVGPRTAPGANGFALDGKEALEPLGDPAAEEAPGETEAEEAA